MGGFRRPGLVVLGLAAGLTLAAGIVTVTTGAGEGARAERRASVAGSVDSLVDADVAVARAVPAPAPAPAPAAVANTRAPATTVAAPRAVGSIVARPTTTTPTPPTTMAPRTPPPTVTTISQYPSNGPALPVVNVRLEGELVIGLAPDSPSHPRLILISGQVQDADGWIRAVTVDWGDGTPAADLDLASRNGGPCPMAGWREPVANVIVLHEPHTYPTLGPRTITVSATSTSCDGVSDRQTGVGRVVLSAVGSP